MNKPKNHHIVSQVHLKHFFNKSDGKIYIYDKLLDNHYNKTSTRRIFSEKNSNTIYRDGIKDYECLEKDLNINFENEFDDNLEKIQSFINNNNVNLKNTICFFAKFGIIGEMRTSRNKAELENVIINALEEVYKHSTNNLKNKIESMLSYKKEVKYCNAVKFSEISEKIFEVMGKLKVLLVLPKYKSDFFIIPDCSSFTTREKINTYFNPDIKEIAFIGISLTSKIHLAIMSEKLVQAPKEDLRLLIADTAIVKQINKLSYDYCQSKIACENKDYLFTFIKELKNE